MSDVLTIAESLPSHDHRFLNRGRPHGVRLRATLRTASACLLWLGLASLTLGVALASAWVVALAAGLLSLALVANDASRAKRGGISPITMYAFVSALTSFANLTGLLAADTPARSQFFLYAVEDKLYLASLLSCAGAVLPVLGFWAVRRNRRLRSWASVLPPVTGNLGQRSLVVGGVGASALAIWLHTLPRTSAPGTGTALFFLLPQIAAFTFARRGTEHRRKHLIVLALLLASAEALRALLFDFLRMNVLAPFIAFTLGMLFGARSLRPLRTKFFAPVYAFALLFVVYFASFGAMRSRTGSGLARLKAVVEHEALADETGAVPRQSVWSRLTDFNQLSQVGRVVEEGGYLHGATLEYLAFVFIPRFLWKDKPIIAKGGWFAWRIGQGGIRPDGRYSNSINMTVPGELFLNFGWLGVTVGCVLFGAILAVFWTSTRFWAGSRNVFGTAFGYYLIWVGTILGADLQILVTITAMYALFVAASLAFKTFQGATADPADGSPSRESVPAHA